MFDFNDPNNTGTPPVRDPYVANTACASIGSPNDVPVPCASTTSTSDADKPAAPNAARITRSCAGPLGAVKPFDAPSEFTALPRTTANTR
ncbi:hypothetical protein Vgi01_60580 [Micromonospora gifhornensis]|uniref:Uncharacterized protein n=1 Tax=Micromonospora gifhornensis TaxID=84594 RepID=A0ABQ4IN78_9ACTN|nr:hypothetical protein Vgi01_60580 [Micromonospora gifhornensis]